MFSYLFSTFVYNPLYNSLFFLINHIPYADVGIAVVLLTIAVKLLLLPLAHTAIRSQIMMNAIKPQLEAIRDKYKKDKQEQARQTMSLYKEKKINPLAMIVPLIIQIPIIFGLYWVFLRGGLPEVNISLLYSFIHIPNVVNMQFLGLVDMGGKSIILAFLAGITQFIHTRISFPKLETKNNKQSFKNDLAKSMQIQMRYVLPIIIGVISYTISAAVALYWTTSNLFAIGQEIFIRRRIIRRAEEKEVSDAI
ncbi:MAG TPA: YidC/Oxa1 family membrane protein insertase [Candidatus Kaiserbacteria bacterium]|nr:YidC/Oxa1 family membrane protein insertase [Candidatus Kaiserbacteria bacterium]